MKQRAIIAMSLACDPSLVIADEPTTALDVIVQDRILRELRRIRRERQLSMLYISHDMAVIAEMADVVAVMYAGSIVEMGPTAEIFARPVHPYTAALMAASPSLRGPLRRLVSLPGRPPNLLHPPTGCAFHPRCPRATGECEAQNPRLEPHRDGLVAACWHPLPAGGEGAENRDGTAEDRRKTAEDRGRTTEDRGRTAEDGGRTAEDRGRTTEDRGRRTEADIAATVPLVQIANARKLFPVGGGLFRRARHLVHAVDDVSLEIAPGEAFGLVGESGSGKTTLGRLLVQLEQPTAGSLRIQLNGTADEFRLIDRQTFRRNVQMIFQDPYESLNPRMTIGRIVAEPLETLRLADRDERAVRTARMLDRVGLAPAASFLHRYPHELSGGQRQRVAIARAMIVEPRFVVADEPTSMLDVSVRAGIMELLLELRRDFGVGYLYVTHDLAVARYLCTRIAVMYQGKLVELGPTEDVLQHPLHPYTRALIAAVPVPDPSYRRPEPAIGPSVAAPIDPPPVCRFLSRCPDATDRCRANAHPALEERRAGHWVACWEAEEVRPGSGRVEDRSPLPATLDYSNPAEPEPRIGNTNLRS